MLGLTEDYDALHEQISRGQRLLAKMDIQTQEVLSPTGQRLGPKVPLSVPPSKFLFSTNTDPGRSLKVADTLLEGLSPHRWPVFTSL